MIVPESVAVACVATSLLSSAAGLIVADLDPAATSPDTAKYLLYTALATLITAVPAMIANMVNGVVKIRANEEAIRLANVRADQAEKLAQAASERADRFSKRADEQDQELRTLRLGVSQGQKWMAETARANETTPANIPPAPPPIHATDPETHVLTGEGFTALLTEPAKDA